MKHACALLLCATLLACSDAAPVTGDATANNGNNAAPNNDAPSNDGNNDAPNNDPNNAVNNDGNNDAPNNDAPEARVVINEVAAAGEPSDWFEVLNLSDQAVELSGWTFTDTLDEPTKGAFAPGTTLAPGAYLQVMINDEAVGFKLGGDEELHLFDPQGILADGVDWAEGDSPTGGSYSRIPDGTGDFQAVIPGTPGARNEVGPSCGDGVCEGDETPERCEDDCGPPETGLVINEVAAAGEPADWVELYNGTNDPVNLSGFGLTDDPAEPFKGVIPDDTAVGPREFLVLEITDEGLGFKLGGDEEVHLFDPQGNPVDGVDWAEGDSPAGGSLARIPSGTGDFQTVDADTRGASND